MRSNILFISILAMLSVVIFLTQHHFVSGASADISSDGVVDVVDLGILLSNWNQTGTNRADLNENGTVDIQDLGILLSAWGASGTSTPIPTQTPTPTATPAPDTGIVTEISRTDTTVTYRATWLEQSAYEFLTVRDTATNAHCCGSPFGDASSPLTFTAQRGAADVTYEVKLERWDKQPSWPSNGAVFEGFVTFPNITVPRTSTTVTPTPTLSPIPNPIPSGNVISLNPSTKYQTITGWEASEQAGHGTASYPLYRDELFDRAINELGITRLRMHLRSGMEHGTDYYAQHENGQIDDATWRCVRYSTVNDNNDPNSINWAGFKFNQLDQVVQLVILPFKQAVEASGQKFYLNLNYVAFIGQMTGAGCPSGLGYHHNDADEYAEYILAATLHLKNKYNLVPDAWEIILEPEHNGHFSGTYIGNVIVKTAARLKAAGFTPKFIAPSTTRHYNAVPYFNDIVAISGAAQYIEELAYHRYSSPTVADLKAIGAKANQYGVNTSMLEHIKSDYIDLHNDIKHANVSSWQQFVLAFSANDSGAQYYMVDSSDPSNPRITMASRTKLLRQYFHYIRPGAVRIAASTSNGTFDPVAFINANGTYVVVVKANASGQFSLSGLPAGTYGINYSTGQASNVDNPDITISAGQYLTTSIPGTGALTIYQK